ncbi:MAG TPA: serine--tRNA ligase [Candidatus Aenigmarchaeota archaeon]|nr:serine--tRNA ligase [Candidatus Aenigmarchaeota archaeon]
MLDIRLFRENLDVILESERRRGKDPNIARMVLDYDIKWRNELKKLEMLRHERNINSMRVGKLKKEKKDVSGIIEKVKKINEEIKKSEERAELYLKKRDELRYKVGNILHESVPDGSGESSNVPVRFHGVAKVWRGHLETFKKETKERMRYVILEEKPASHVEIIERYGLADLVRASKVSGARFYYLKNELVILNYALQRFALDYLAKKGFTLFYTPFMINYEAIRGAAELGDFEEMLYKIDGKNLFLIATAEQTLAAYHMNETLQEEELPKLYAGFSTNFRKEAGAHGLDTKGIFRVHQFDKIEQYVFCLPEESWKWHEELIKNAEELFKNLAIPYRVINICAGDMNDNAAKKYDIEAWMPSQGRFREVVSCSNTTDYQARKLNITVRRKNGTKEVVHTLNSTAIATQRTIVAILENNQEDGVIKVPDVLHKYTGFKEIILKGANSGSN